MFSALAQVANEGDDVITTDTTGARTRTVSELQAIIRAAGGRVVAWPNDSNYIVAVNNGLRFSVTALANGQYAITESNALLYTLIGAGLVGLLLIARG